MPIRLSLNSKTLWVIVTAMTLCEKTSTQLPLENLEVKSEGSPNHSKSSALQGGTEEEVAVQKKREYYRAWKKSNPEKVKANHERYYEKNRDRILAKERERWRAKYGPPKHVFGRSEEEKLALKKEQQHRNYLANREERLAYAARHRAEHPGESKEASRKRYASLTIEQRQKEQREARARRLAKDPDCDKRRSRNRFKNDSEFRAKTLAASKKWANDNPEKHRKIVRECRRKRIAKDPCFRLRCLLSTRIHQALAGELKRETTMQLLGCTREEFKAHLESQFQPGMTWKNLGAGPGTWQIDHITPVANFDLRTLEGQRAAFCFRNTQPLRYEDHLKKSATEETGWRRSKPSPCASPATA